MKKLIQRVSESEKKVSMSIMLLIICFTIFTFVITINPRLFQDNKILALQLVLAIPFLMSSIHARAKLAKNDKTLLEQFGFSTYLIGYTFLINVVGISLSIFVSLYISMFFFVANILLSVSYSLVQIEEKLETQSHFTKDLLFALLILFLGVLPALGVY